MDSGPLLLAESESDTLTSGTLALPDEVLPEIVISWSLFCTSLRALRLHVPPGPSQPPKVAGNERTGSGS